MAKLIPWLFLLPPLLVTLLALGSLAYARSPKGRAQARLRQGGIHLYRGELPQAETAFKDALALRPHDSAPLGSLASFLVSQGRHDEARPHADAAVKADPKDWRLVLIQGRCLAGLGEHAAAQAAWASIPKTSDAYLDAQSQSAALHESQGDLPAAIAALERAIEAGEVLAVRPHKAELKRLKKLLAGEPPDSPPAAEQAPPSDPAARPKRERRAKPEAEAPAAPSEE